nr:hypothetical protein HK105_000686 [Polyrhizophydium stewartii]
MTNTSAEFALAGSLPRPSAVGVSVGVRGPLVFRVWRADDPTAATVLTLTADAPLSFTTNADIAVATTGRIVFADMRSLRDALACTACAAGSKTGFVVGTQITVDIAGTTWYRDLALQFALDIAPPGAATPGSDALGSWLPKPFVAPNLNTVIRQKFAAGDLLPLGPGLPDVHVDSLSIVNWTTPGSVVLSLRAMFENPVTASFNTSRAIFGFGSVSGTTHSDVARVTVTPASTAASAGISFVFPGIIDTSVTAEIKFVDPTLAAMSPLLAALSFTLYPSTHPDMTLDGPLQLVAVSGGGDLVGAMTNGTVIHLDHDSISTALSRLRSIVIAQALKQGITGIGL